MSLRFHYSRRWRQSPIISLGGRFDRPWPAVPVTSLGPGGSWLVDGLLDSGSEDTVFPEWMANRLGIDLTTAPTGTAAGVGGGGGLLRYAEVTLRVADNQERREWQAWVGFTSTKLRHPLLGFAGFLQYFTATLYGDREEVELTVNSLYAGT